MKLQRLLGTLVVLVLILVSLTSSDLAAAPVGVTTYYWEQSWVPVQIMNVIVAPIFLPFVVQPDQPDELPDVDETIDQPDVDPPDEVEDVNPPYQVETEHESATEQDVVYQDEHAAQATDIAILAEETGLPTESVERAIAFQQSFAEYADELMIRFPDQISAVWSEPVPNQRGHIQFVANIPSEVTAELAQGIQSSQRNPLQLSAVLTGDNVIVTGEGGISMTAHLHRAELAAEALADQGYQNALTYFDPVDKMLQIELKLPEGVSAPSKLDLIDVVQDRLLAARAATVEPVDLELTVITGSGPIVQPQHGRGGNWLRDGGQIECTSGWSVRSRYGSTGIITAGHCDGLNQFDEPYFVWSILYPMPFIRQVNDLRGDVEYHTTRGHIDFAEFYADSSSIRSVTDIRATNTMVGSYVCFYGRASNVRTCNHFVLAVGVTVVATGDVTVGNLVRASNHSAMPGDSGGGWSLNTTAWGIHHGHGDGNSYFTPVEQAQAALEVTLLTE